MKWKIGIAVASLTLATMSHRTAAGVDLAPVKPFTRLWSFDTGG